MFTDTIFLFFVTFDNSLLNETSSCSVRLGQVPVIIRSRNIQNCNIASIPLNYGQEIQHMYIIIYVMPRVLVVQQLPSQASLLRCGFQSATETVSSHTEQSFIAPGVAIPPPPRGEQVTKHFKSPTCTLYPLHNSNFGKNQSLQSC